MSKLVSGLQASDSIMQVKQALLANAKRAYEIRLQTGNGGNLSGRVPGGDLIIIKASGCSFDQCTADNLVTVTLDGEIVDGDGMPSQELATHLLIYKLRSDVQGIFHSHSPWTIAMRQPRRYHPHSDPSRQVEAGTHPGSEAPWKNIASQSGRHPDFADGRSQSARICPGSARYFQLCRYDRFGALQC